MANENLQNALEQAGLTLEAFAEVIRVDPKSVARWVTGNTIPYPRHREAIARALNVGEHELWPEQTPTIELGRDADVGDERCDVAGSWAHADQDDAPNLLEFILETTGPVDVLDSCCGIPIMREVTDALLARAAADGPVRILTDGRAPHWEPLLGRPGVEILLCEIPGEYWLIKTPGRMLVTINLEQDPDGRPAPPLLELNPNTQDGLFHRLTSRIDELWTLAQGSGPPAAPGTGLSGNAGSADRGTDRGRDGEHALDPGPVRTASARRWPNQPG